MKKEKIMTSFIATFMFVLIISIAGRTEAFANSTITLNISNGSNITSVLQEALDRAGNNTLTVTIPSGTYMIDRNIYIYSNTVLNANGCTIKANSGFEGSMLKGAHKHGGQRCKGDEGGSCNTGGYEQVKNVTVNGGTWDASGSGASKNTQCIMFRHAQNITLKNITAKGSTNHAFNISGVSGATITNCSFTSQVKYVGKDKAFWGDITEGDDSRFNSMEAIHLDFTCKSGEPNALPCDNTPCKNITVSNCKFNGVFSGVGTHHANGDKKKRADNIVIKNCAFTNIRSKDSVNCYGRALTFYTANNVTFQDNTINGAYNAILMDDVSNVKAINNKKVNNIKGNAFYVRNGCKGDIKNNIVTSPKQTGVYVVTSPITVYNNTIANAQTHGIYIEKGTANTKINFNKITNPKKTGIYVNKGTTRVYKNKVSGSKEQGIFLNGAGSSVVDQNTVSATTKEGIYVYSSGSAKIEKNDIANSKSNGIGVMDSRTVKVYSNKINGSANNGMNILVSSKTKTVTADIQNNKVTASKKLGILVEDGTNCVIHKNSITGNKNNGIQVQGKKKKCVGTKITNNLSKSNKGKKDILVNTKCSNTRIVSNSVTKKDRCYWFTDGKVYTK